MRTPTAPQPPRSGCALPEADCAPSLLILGPVALRAKTTDAGSLGGARPRRLLAGLALHAEEAVSADRLVLLTDSPTTTLVCVKGCAKINETTVTVRGSAATQQAFGAGGNQPGITSKRPTIRNRSSRAL